MDGVEAELHKRRLLEYADKTELGIEPNRCWQSYHLGYTIGGKTPSERASVARHLASKL